MTIPPPNPASLEHNARMLARSGGRTPFLARIGLELLEHGHAYARFRLLGQDATRDDEGRIASGVLLAAVDHVGAIAAWMTSELGNRRYFGSTVKTQITLMADVRQPVIVEGRVAASEGELIFADVLITTDAGELVAKGATIYRIIDRGEQGG